MQRLVQRFSLPAVLAASVCMFAVTAASLLLAIQANSRADTYQSRYLRTQTAVHDLCVRREGLETRLRDLERADVLLQHAMIRLGHGARTVAFRLKLAADLRYLRTPVEDGCEALHP